MWCSTSPTCWPSWTSGPCSPAMSWSFPAFTTRRWSNSHRSHVDPLFGAVQRLADAVESAMAGDGTLIVINNKVEPERPPPPCPRRSPPAQRRAAGIPVAPPAVPRRCRHGRGGGVDPRRHYRQAERSSRQAAVAASTRATPSTFSGSFLRYFVNFACRKWWCSNVRGAHTDSSRLACSHRHGEYPLLRFSPPQDDKTAGDHVVMTQRPVRRLPAVVDVHPAAVQLAPGVAFGRCQAGSDQGVAQQQAA